MHRRKIQYLYREWWPISTSHQLRKRHATAATDRCLSADVPKLLPRTLHESSSALLSVTSIRRITLRASRQKSRKFCIKKKTIFVWLGMNGGKVSKGNITCHRSDRKQGTLHSEVQHCDNWTDMRKFCSYPKVEMKREPNVNASKLLSLLSLIALHI